MAFYAGRDHPRAGDGEPDDRRPHRPQRPRRPALRHVLALPGAAAPAAGAGREPRRICASCCSVAAGGVVFTTIQKFFPEEKGDTLPDALRPAQHRRDRRRGAPQPVRLQSTASPRHMRDALPNASFIGFTGTPIETDRREHAGGLRRLHQTSTTSSGRSRTGRRSRSTTRAGWRSSTSTRPSGRRSTPSSRRSTEGEEVERKEKLKSKWAQLEAVVGAEKRIELIAEDIVEHFEKRLEAMDGKAMIVCMSRRICVDLYDEIVKLRPGVAQHEDDDKGAIKVVMTGSATDPVDWQQHIREQARAARRSPSGSGTRSDPFKLVIVRDMWLTGFDAPVPAHDVRRQADARPRADAGDRPRQPRLQGQARRPGRRLPRARRRAQGGARAPTRRAAAPGQTAHRPGGGRRGHAGEVRGLLRPVPRLRLVAVDDGHAGRAARAASRRRRSTSSPRRTARSGSSRPCASSRRRSRWRCRTTRRSRIRDDVALLPGGPGGARQATRPATAGPEEDLDHAIRQIVSAAVASDEVVDIFAAAGLKKPDISILSDEFLAEVRGMPQRNLAVELLRKLLKDEIKAASPQERRPGALVRRDARADDPPLPEPGDRDGAGHRGADRAGQGDARGRARAARSSG